MRRKKLFLFSLSMMAIVAVALVASSTFTIAANNTIQGGGLPQGNPPNGQQGNFKNPGIMGTVSSISGSIITVKMNDISYTIDASSATIKKITNSTGGSKPTETTISVSDIQSGNTAMIQGTVSGTSVTATEIIVGAFTGGSMNNGIATTSNRNQGRLPANPATSTPKNKIQNRSSAVIGTVSAISGTTITITSRQDTGITYTIDASNAKVTQGAGENTQTSSVSDIKVGDVIEVAGAISISATSIIEKGNMSTSTESGNIERGNDNNQPQNNASDNKNGESDNTAHSSGFWSKIKNFFGF